MPITIQTSEKSVENSKKKPSDHISILQKMEIYKQKAAGEILCSSIGKEKVYESLFNNGFVGVVMEAYNNHHNLVIRPDDVWLAIVSQLSIYIDKNAETLRDKFVSHQGKIELEAKDWGDRYTVNYPKMIAIITEKAGELLKDENIKDFILPNFTTTTDTDKTVASVILMSAFQKYFSYKMTCMCGIPNITLQGELSDWKEIYRRVELIDQYNAEDFFLTKWKNMLLNILDNFISAFNGKIDQLFFGKICCEISGGSGPSYLSGWITVFCCFGSEGKWYGDDLSVNHWGKIKTNEINMKYPIIETNDINIGFITVPFILVDNEKLKAMLFAGHLFHKVIDKNTLKPRVDWIVSLVDESKQKSAKGYFG